MQGEVDINGHPFVLSPDVSLQSYPFHSTYPAGIRGDSGAPSADDVVDSWVFQGRVDTGPEILPAVTAKVLERVS